MLHILNIYLCISPSVCIYLNIHTFFQLCCLLLPLFSELIEEEPLKLKDYQHQEDFLTVYFTAIKKIYICNAAVLQFFSQ